MQLKYRRYINNDEKGIKLQLFSKADLSSFSDDTIVALEQERAVGFLDLDVLDEQNGIYNLSLIEVARPKSGYGEKILNDIKNWSNVKKLVINPLENTYAFWTKQGFSQENESDWCWVKK